MRVPDGIVPIKGWRMWNLPPDVEAPITLLSLGKSRSWKPGVKAEAHCTLFKHEGEVDEFSFGFFRQLTPAVIAQTCPHCHKSLHESPEKECSCGLWAYRTPELCRDSGYAAAVLGEVALWGKIIEHEKGFRAQYAYPLRLYVDAPAIDRLAPFGVPVMNLTEAPCEWYATLTQAPVLTGGTSITIPNSLWATGATYSIPLGATLGATAGLTPYTVSFDWGPASEEEGPFELEDDEFEDDEDEGGWGKRMGTVLRRMFGK